MEQAPNVLPDPPHQATEATEPRSQAGGNQLSPDSSRRIVLDSPVLKHLVEQCENVEFPQADELWL